MQPATSTVTPPQELIPDSTRVAPLINPPPLGVNEMLVNAPKHLSLGFLNSSPVTIYKGYGWREAL